MSDQTSPRILVIHGPNLNMLGTREPEIYGHLTLDMINADIADFGNMHDTEIEIFQSNHEGEIVECIQQAMGSFDGLIINPGAYTHTSVAIHDALLLLDFPIIEVHLSNIYKRETFRHKSMVSSVATAQITGMGAYGYILAVMGVMTCMSENL